MLPFFPLFLLRAHYEKALIIILYSPCPEGVLPRLETMRQRQEGGKTKLVCYRTRRKKMEEDCVFGRKREGGIPLFGALSNAGPAPGATDPQSPVTM